MNAGESYTHTESKGAGGGHKQPRRPSIILNVNQGSLAGICTDLWLYINIYAKKVCVHRNQVGSFPIYSIHIYRYCSSYKYACIGLFPRP